MFERFATKVSEYSRRYQIDLAYIIKSQFWVYLAQGILLITGLATSVAFARLASQEILGQYNFIFAILAIVALLSIPGLDNAVLRSVARGNEGSYKAAVKTRFLWSLLAIPALLGIGGYYYYYNTPIIGIVLIISSVFFPFIHAPKLWVSFLQGKRKFKVLAKYGSIRFTINAIAVITILFLSPNRLILIVVANLTVNSFLTLLFYRRSQKYIKNRTEDNECKKYGYFLTTTEILGTIAQNIDKILIGTLLGAPRLAVYYIALLIPTRITSILKPVWAPFMPKFSQDDIKINHVLEKTKKLVLPLTLATLGGSLIYWFFIDDIILLLFSSKYTESIIYSKILLVSVLASVPTVFLRRFTTAKMDKKALVLGLYVFSILKLGITAGFIYLWGLMGAVWALNLGRIIQVVLFVVGMRDREILQTDERE